MYAQIILFKGRRGADAGPDNVVYWKCEVKQKLEETLAIPITNAAREQALVIAAQQVGSIMNALEEKENLFSWIHHQEL